MQNKNDLNQEDLDFPKKHFTMVKTNWEHAVGFDVTNAADDKYEGTVVFWKDSFLVGTEKSGFLVDEKKEENSNEIQMEYDWVDAKGDNIPEPEWLGQAMARFITFLLQTAVKQDKEKRSEKEA